MVRSCVYWTFGIYFISFLKVFSGCATIFAMQCTALCLKYYSAGIAESSTHPYIRILSLSVRTVVCCAVACMPSRIFHGSVTTYTDVDNTDLRKHCIRPCVRKLEKDVCCMRIICWIDASGLCAESVCFRVRSVLLCPYVLL